MIPIKYEELKAKIANVNGQVSAMLGIISVKIDRIANSGREEQMTTFKLNNIMLRPEIEFKNSVKKLKETMCKCRRKPTKKLRKKKKDQESAKTRERKENT
jgi:hypothetical protein